MRILVIEDETKVGCFIKRALDEESYAVDLCEDGAKGLQMALDTNYDLLIVDLMLPSLSGLDILKGVRQARIQRLKRRSPGGRGSDAHAGGQILGHGAGFFSAAGA